MSAEKWADLMPEMWKAFYQTLYMVGVSLLIAIIIGIPLGVLLFISGRRLFWSNGLLYWILGFISNLIRSVPFVILLVLLLPVTQSIVGSTIGPTSAIVPLAVAAIPFFARLVETSMREIDKGVIESAVAAGASPWLIIRGVLLSEARPGIVSGLTITAISLLGFSAMAGIVGGGGIGDLAIRFGYYRYDNFVMFTTVIVLIVLVQIIQWIGDWATTKVSKK